jgi:hypothetical protein
MALSVREFLTSKQITAGMPSLYTGSSPLDFFSVPEYKGNIERKAF